MLADRIIPGELAFVYKNCQSRRSKGFAARREREDGVRCNGVVGLDVANAEPLKQGHLAVTNYGDCNAGHMPKSLRIRDCFHEGCIILRPVQ